MSTVTVAAGHFENYEGDETTLKLRRYVHKKFITSTGNIIMPGRVGTPRFYDTEITCPVSGGNVNYPEFTFDSTSDAISDPKRTYYDLALFTTAGKFVKTVAQKIRVPATPSSTNLADLIIYSGQGVPVVADEAYTKEQTDAQHANLVSTAQKSSTSQFGVAKSSAAHADPLNPIHVSTTDPKLSLTDSPLVLAYKAVTLACFGDSITFGYSTTTPWPKRLENKLHSVVINRGVNGTNAAAASAKLTLETMFQDNFVIIWVGHNDIGGGSVASVKASVAAMVATLGHSNYLILGTLNQHSMNSGSAGHTFVTTLNTDLAALYPNNFFDMRAYLVSFSSGADLANDVIATAYLSDGQHPNDAGAELIAAKLATLFAPRVESQKSLHIAEKGIISAGGRPFVYVPDLNTNFTAWFGCFPLNPTVIPTRSMFFTTHFEPSSPPTGDYMAVFGSAAAVGCSNSYDSYFGAFSGNAANGGNSNSCFGYYSGGANQGYQNAFFGANAGKLTTTGSYNAFFGTGAGSANLTGSQCVFLGVDAGNLATSGNNKVLIGYGVQASSPTASDELNICNLIKGDLATGIAEIASGKKFKITSSQTPASAAAAGVQGQIAWDANYIYICVAANTWKRVAIATW